MLYKSKELKEYIDGNFIKIKPIKYIEFPDKEIIITHIKIENIIITKLNEEAIVNYSIYSISKENEHLLKNKNISSILNPIKIYNFTISGEEYEKWNNDDYYIFELLIKKLNLELNQN